VRTYAPEVSEAKRREIDAAMDSLIKRELDPDTPEISKALSRRMDGECPAPDAK